MKLSEHIKMFIANCDETKPSLIRKKMIKEIGVEVSIDEIQQVQQQLISEYEKSKY